MPLSALDRVHRRSRRHGHRLSISGEHRLRICPRARRHMSAFRVRLRCPPSIECTPSVCPSRRTLPTASHPSLPTRHTFTPSCLSLSLRARAAASLAGRRHHTPAALPPTPPQLPAPCALVCAVSCPGRSPRPAPPSASAAGLVCLRVFVCEPHMSTRAERTAPRPFSDGAPRVNSLGTPRLHRPL
jgi:hypothetical protein